MRALENYFEDGTKIESASGRHTFVWKKTVEKNDKKLDEKLRAYVRVAEKVWDEENGEYGNRDLEETGGIENCGNVGRLKRKRYSGR